MIKVGRWSRRFLAQALLPMGIGLGLGGLVVADALIGPHHPLWGWPAGDWARQGFPWTLTLVIVAIAGVVMLRSGDRLFAQRVRLAAMAPVIASTVNGLSVGRIDAFEFAFIFSSLVWLAATLVEDRPVVVPRVFVCLLVGLLIGALLSAMNGRIGSLFGSLMAMRSIVAKVVIAFLIVNLVTTPRDVHALLRLLFALAIVSVIMAIAAPVVHATTGIILSTEGGTMQFKWTPFGRMLRATALCHNPQALGHFLIATLGVTLLTTRGTARAVLVTLLCTGVLLTLSMGAILTTVGVLVISPFVARPDRSLHYFAIGGAVLVVAYLTGIAGWVFETFVAPTGGTPTGGRGVEDRTERLREGLMLIERHPWLGIGLDNSRRALTHPVHNTYVQVATEVGLLSTVFFTAILLYATLRCLVVARAHPDGKTRAVLMGLFLGMVGLMVHFSNNPLFLDTFSWCYIGIVMSATLVFGRERTDIAGTGR